jgi:hypothetical protein
VIEPTYIDLDQLQVVGQALLVDITATNHGLVAAKDINLRFGEHPFYHIEPLIDNIDSLAAKSSITVPVRITRIADFDTLGSAGNELILQSTPSISCFIPSGLEYSYECGGEQITRAIPIPIFNVDGNCFSTGSGSPGGGGGGIGEDGIFRYDNNVLFAIAVGRALGGLFSGGKLDYGKGLVTPVAVNIQPANCDPCVENTRQALYNCAINAGIASLFNRRSLPSIISDCIIELVQACPVSILDSADLFRSTTSGVKTAIKQLEQMLTLLQPLVNTQTILFGSEIWLQSGKEDPDIFTNWVNSFEIAIGLGKYNSESLSSLLAAYDSLLKGEINVSSRISNGEKSALLQMPLPSRISGSDVEQLIDRWNRTFDYYTNSIYSSTEVPNGQSLDFVEVDVWHQAFTGAKNSIERSEIAGFADPVIHTIESINELQQALEGDSSGVCAQVKIQIDQEAVMTRSAFLGSLEIDNGNLTNLTNLTVTLQINDANGNIVNDLFGITSPILNNLTAVDGTGILTGDDPNTPQDEGIGSAKWTFIPTNLAAPEVPTQYSIGGTLAYQENGKTITVPLLSAPITVYPQAELHLDYFQSRNVYGDDPFTDPIEPSIPFGLAVLVQNQGKGDAKNLSITSAQPKLIDNEKGLLIDPPQIIGSQVNGTVVSPSLAVNFGTIKAGQTAVADWLLKSSLQGKFIDYSATFEHTNSLGACRT